MLKVHKLIVVIYFLLNSSITILNLLGYTAPEREREGQKGTKNNTFTCF